MCVCAYARQAVVTMCVIFGSDASHVVWRRKPFTVEDGVLVGARTANRQAYRWTFAMACTTGIMAHPNAIHRQFSPGAACACLRWFGASPRSSSALPQTVWCMCTLFLILLRDSVTTSSLSPTPLSTLPTPPLSCPPERHHRVRGGGDRPHQRRCGVVVRSYKNNMNSKNNKNTT